MNPRLTPMVPRQRRSLFDRMTVSSQKQARMTSIFPCGRAHRRNNMPLYRSLDFVDELCCMHIRDALWLCDFLKLVGACTTVGHAKLFILLPCQQITKIQD